MEIMEEGNVLDRVRILLQRDLAYYKEHQKIILQKLCPAVIGGFLDFPNITTFVAMKIAMWWEESYYLLFHSYSSVFSGNVKLEIKILKENDISLNKLMTPKEFVNLVSQSCKMLLDHLNLLSLEALDHTDVSVLTGTIGAATLIRNTIWVYDQQLHKTNSKVSLSKELKNYQSMSEELAERLLDLHCRLISLYILQDADCLNWSGEHQFFEGERSSYTIQMWWFYIQCVREDLRDSMSPKTAARILSGILNESLTILTSRYLHIHVSKSRNDLVIADLSNILLCVFKVLPSVCKHADELFGCKPESNVIRDIHSKCQSLFTYFLMRAVPLKLLYKIFKNGFSETPCLAKKQKGVIEPWIIFALQEQSEHIPPNLYSCNQLIGNSSLKYHLLVSISKDFPEWTQFLKVLRMNDCWILHEILHCVIVNEEECQDTKDKQESCKEFLCKDECISNSSLQRAILNFLIINNNKNDIENCLMKVLDKIPDRWGIYFNYSQIWNQNRPLWIQALISHIQPAVQYVLKLSKNVIKGDSTVCVISHYIDNMKKMISCVPYGVLSISSMIENILPPDILPLENSVFIQLMAMALYDELGNESNISEALCRIGESSTGVFQKTIQEAVADILPNLSYSTHDVVDEILIHHMFVDKIGRKSIKVLHRFFRQDASHWLLEKLGIEIKAVHGGSNLLKNMFYIGNREYDEVLSGKWVPKWATLLTLPLGLRAEELSNLLLARPEFSSDRELVKQDQIIIKHIKMLCQQ